MNTRSPLALLALTVATLPAMARHLDANGIGRTELVRHDVEVCVSTAGWHKRKHHRARNRTVCVGAFGV